MVIYSLHFMVYRITAQFKETHLLGQAALFSQLSCRTKFGY